MIQRMKFLPALFLMLLVFATGVLKSGAHQVEINHHGSADEISATHFSDAQGKIFEINSNPVHIVHVERDGFQRTVTPFFIASFQLSEIAHVAISHVFTEFIWSFSLSESKNKLLYPFHFFW